MMKSILRELKTVTPQQVTINLPNYWEAQEVEVIVIPRLTVPNPGSEAWQQDFLTVSQWQITEEEVRIKSWPVEEF